MNSHCHRDVHQRHPREHQPWTTWKSKEIMHDGEEGTEEKLSSLF